MGRFTGLHANIKSYVNDNAQKVGKGLNFVELSFQVPHSNQEKTNITHST